MKTLDDYFADWENAAIGFGYGSGEEHVIPALQAFVRAIPGRGPKGEYQSYDYRDLEAAVGPVAAWLFISIFGHSDLIEYGGSSRFAWLTDRGIALKSYLDSTHTEHILGRLADCDYVYCYPDHCNCDGEPCRNPFWRNVPSQGTE